jgi:hypothetical protein
MNDWPGFTNDIDQLFSDFDKFLAVCVANNITLNTTKTRIGCSSAQFFGFTVRRCSRARALPHYK